MLRLVEDDAVSIIIAVVQHVDYIVAAGHKSRCGRFLENLSCLAPINDTGELKRYWLPLFLRQGKHVVFDLAKYVYGSIGRQVGYDIASGKET